MMWDFSFSGIWGIRLMLTFRRDFLFALLALLPAATMNAQDAPKPTVPGADVFEAREFKGADGKVLKYRLLKPIDFDSNAKEKYPLVLFLHGAGERGDDNVRQLVHGGRNFADDALRKRYPAFVIAPQCPAEQKWVEVPWDLKVHGMPEEPSESLGLTFEAIEALKQEFPIDESRLYGMGLSMGGFGTWDILQRKPGMLAAAVPICGGGDPKHVEGFKSTPIWVFHGGADPIVIPPRSRDMVAALKAAGGTPIYTEYEGVGHDSWTPTFDNRQTWDWLFAQRKSN